MKLWLNHILACPDDKSFPLKVGIFSWETPTEEFSLLLEGFKERSLMNFKDPKDPIKIQKLDTNISQKDAIQRNKKVFQDQSYQKIIKVTKKKGRILIIDSNQVNPCEITEYFDYYINFLNEFEHIQDETDEEISNTIHEIIKNQITAKIQDFSKQPKENPLDFTNIEELYAHIEPILQELLLLNYYIFNMEIEEGILKCPQCMRLFPIIGTIPRLLPKDMEKDEIDDKFEKRWKDKIS